MKMWLMNRIIILRGVLSPSCFWYKVSDFILDDGSGIDLYNKYKEKYGDFALTEMFGEKIYLVDLLCFFLFWVLVCRAFGLF